MPVGPGQCLGGRTPSVSGLTSDVAAPVAVHPREPSRPPAGLPTLADNPGMSISVKAHQSRLRSPGTKLSTGRDTPRHWARLGEPLCGGDHEYGCSVDGGQPAGAPVTPTANAERMTPRSQAYTWRSSWAAQAGTLKGASWVAAWGFRLARPVLARREEHDTAALFDSGETRSGKARLGLEVVLGKPLEVGIRRSRPVPRMVVVSSMAWQAGSHVQSLQPMTVRLVPSEMPRPTWTQWPSPSEPVTRRLVSAPACRVAGSVAAIFVDSRSSSRYHDGPAAAVYGRCLPLGLPTPCESMPLPTSSGHATCTGSCRHRVLARHTQWRARGIHSFRPRRPAQDLWGDEPHSAHGRASRQAARDWRRAAWQPALA